MKKLILIFCVPLLTFIVGINLSRLKKTPVPPPQPAAVAPPATPRITKAEPTPSPSPPQVEEDNTDSDLAVVVQVDGPEKTSVVEHIKLDQKRQAVIVLDMSEHIDGQLVTLSFRDSSVPYRVLQRYRTTLSVS